MGSEIKGSCVGMWISITTSATLLDIRLGGSALAETNMAPFEFQGPQTGVALGRWEHPCRPPLTLASRARGEARICSRSVSGMSATTRAR